MTDANQQDKLQHLPGVDKALNYPQVKELVTAHGREVVVYALRRVIDESRESILKGEGAALSLEQITARVVEVLKPLTGRSLRRVINATGVILHTNLGRAPFGEKIIRDIQETLSGYTNLEFDLKRGSRGKRTAHVVDLLRFLTGAEDAVVVNNNAAAVVLTLNTFARDREIVVSRGELIEIGGSFRIPDIMATSGALMVEVGTTNRTHLADYENAISPETGLIFKAHQSNYAIRGFTEEVSVKELAEFAHSKGLLLVYDIGSGLLRQPQEQVLEDEPDVRTALDDGADLVTFSCDKLLGGPQGGIIAGRKELVKQLAKSPLMRVLRVGKLTMAALSSACRQYLRDEDLLTCNPLFTCLKRSSEQLNALAVGLLNKLEASQVVGEVVPSGAHSGGGSMPDRELESFAVVVKPPADWEQRNEVFAEKLFHQLLQGEPPVVGVLRKGELLLDMLTVFEPDLEELAGAVCRAVTEIRVE